ncbi:sugar kinase, ribokinase [Sphaerochaeta pleomorpha str. Grapes]|uniref:Sugar kinase, ribokinase n=1 Tax=Sphaerochaeta pleomorpha (strain ATCC BAA-1885 / DSM 22778 / Grapes) TaxID=158190 RepID=G8QSZ1_SPHPG|nr:sugar kinase [Sphaerochaeta pleomorpha]AEV27896.1 sugar kinase, ribokinase [Sphaerochaeta pleomorpha str. Grapes]
MIEVVTIGETMVAFIPNSNTYLRYVNSFGKVTAGAESNVSVGLSKLGHTSGWISKLGDDEFGEFILRELRGEGVDTSRVLRTNLAPTGIMFKQLSSDKESSVFYYRKGSAASLLCPEDLDEEYIKQARILLISGITPALSNSCKETVLRAIEIARANKVLVCFDPNIRRKLWNEDAARMTLLPILSLSDIVLLGDDEANILLGETDQEKIVEALRKLNVRWIAVKKGKEGAYVADSENEFSIPIFPMKVVDTIGAGDAFNAGFISGLLENRPVEECGKMASIMGAFAVSSPGDVEGLPNRKTFDRVASNIKETQR